MQGAFSEYYVTLKIQMKCKLETLESAVVSPTSSDILRIPTECFKCNSRKVNCYSQFYFSSKQMQFDIWVKNVWGNHNTLRKYQKVMPIHNYKIIAPTPRHSIDTKMDTVHVRRNTQPMNWRTYFQLISETQPHIFFEQIHHKSTQIS